MPFFESEGTDVLKAARIKLFASNELQIDNYTLMLDMLNSYMSVVCTYHCRGVFRNTFLYSCCFLFVAKKVTRGTELQFLYTQGALQGGREEDHKVMFTRHFHLPQSYIQAILYIYKTD